MNSPQLTLPLLDKFLSLSIGYRDYLEIDDEGILSLVTIIDNEEQLYHVEGKKVYKKKAWLKDLDRLARQRREHEELMTIKDERLRKLKEIQLRLSEEFGVDKDNEIIIKMALNIIRRGKEKTANMIGVDINNVPTMPTSYYILDYPTTDGTMEIKL